MITAQCYVKLKENLDLQNTNNSPKHSISTFFIIVKKYSLFINYNKI